MKKTNLTNKICWIKCVSNDTILFGKSIKVANKILNDINDPIWEQIEEQIWSITKGIRKL